MLSRAADWKPSAVSKYRQVCYVMHAGFNDQTPGGTYSAEQYDKK